MIPTEKTVLTFWEKFLEIQTKMLWSSKQVQVHMFSSEPQEWPLLDKTIAYWINTKSNAQIHLVGNLIIWYSASIAVVSFASIFPRSYFLNKSYLFFSLSMLLWAYFIYCDADAYAMTYQTKNGLDFWQLAIYFLLAI